MDGNCANTHHMLQSVSFWMREYVLVGVRSQDLKVILYDKLSLAELWLTTHDSKSSMPNLLKLIAKAQYLVLLRWQYNKKLMTQEG